MLGGVMDLPAEMREAGVPPNWLASIAVPDVDEAADRAKERGASVQVGPLDIPTVGRYAVLTDPQGAAFALFSAEEHWPGSDAPAEIGAMSWHELATSDWSSAWDFYRETFGWEDATAMDMGPDLGMYQMFGRNGLPVGGIYNRPADQGPPAWLHYTRVEDTDRAAERVKQLGGQVVTEPMDVPGGDRVAVCADPQGALFAVHSIGAG
jgi:predicted enzyme related to lactoylglutathione lyase